MYYHSLVYTLSLDFAPLHPCLWYNYVHELSLPIPYSYSCENNLGTLWYAWKLPCDPSEHDVSKQIMGKIDSSIPYMGDASNICVMLWPCLFVRQKQLICTSF